MCCRTTVSPLISDVAEAILAIGLFEKQQGNYWIRTIPEEESMVTASLRENELALSISPPVSSLEGHHHKRIAASVAYEIAARYAEKVNGTIQQTTINVPTCMVEGTSARTLAVYPASRLDYEALCPGFRSVFLGEVE